MKIEKQQEKEKFYNLKRGDIIQIQEESSPKEIHNAIILKSIKKHLVWSNDKAYEVLIDNKKLIFEMFINKYYKSSDIDIYYSLSSDYKIESTYYYSKIIYPP